MPSKDATAPTAREIDLPKHFSERQHRVVAFKIEVLDLVRLGQRPMVRVMKEQQETSPPNAMTAEACHQAGLSPFMHEHDVCIGEGFVEIERRALIRFDRYSRHKLRAAHDRGRAMIPQQIGAAPSVRRLVDHHLVPQIYQLARNSPKEMRIAVV